VRAQLVAFAPPEERAMRVKRRMFGRCIRPSGIVASSRHRSV
jgi:hypothetical protein